MTLQDHFLTACRENNLSWVKAIVEGKHREEVRLELGLVSASYRGHFELVKYLVRQGADIHFDRDTAMIWAGVYGHEEIANYLRNRVIGEKLEGI